MLKRVYLKFLIRFVVPEEILEALTLNYVNCPSKGMPNEVEYHERIQHCLAVANEWLAAGQRAGWQPVIQGMAREHERNLRQRTN